MIGNPEGKQSVLGIVNADLLTAGSHHATFQVVDEDAASHIAYQNDGVPDILHLNALLCLLTMGWIKSRELHNDEAGAEIGERDHVFLTLHLQILVQQIRHRI